jgi:hypothetical protein
MNSTFPPGSLSQNPNAGAEGRNSTFLTFLRAQGQFDDLGPTTRISVWLLAGAGLVFLLLRLYCKILRHRRLHADDYFLIAAWVSSRNRRMLERKGRLTA